MADISKIKIEDGTYDIKDQTARNQIAQLQVPHNYFANKKFILIGDSYATGWTPDGTYTSWQEHFISITGLSNTITKSQGGSGFVNISSNKTFETLLDEVTPSNEITDIVVLGGYNDRSYNATQIGNAINSFVLLAKQDFPNARIHIGEIGWAKNGAQLYDLSRVVNNYKHSSAQFGVHYISNIEYSLHDYSYFSSDNVHPNANGQLNIGKNLVQGIIGGSVEPLYVYTWCTFSANSGITLDGFGSIGALLNNGYVEVTNQNAGSSVNFNPKITKSGRNNWIEVASITGGLIYGSDFHMQMIPVRCVVHCDEGYLNAYGQLKFMNGKLYIGIGGVNASGNNYQTFTNIDQIQIEQFHGVFSALMC